MRFFRRLSNLGICWQHKRVWCFACIDCQRIRYQ